jgi:hypothetical protein
VIWITGRNGFRRKLGDGFLCALRRNDTPTEGSPSARSPKQSISTYFFEILGGVVSALVLLFRRQEHRPLRHERSTLF